MKIPGLCAKDRDFVRRILRTWKEDDGDQVDGSAYTYSGYRWALAQPAGLALFPAREVFHDLPVKAWDDPPTESRPGHNRRGRLRPNRSST